MRRKMPKPVLRANLDFFNEFRPSPKQAASLEFRSNESPTEAMSDPGVRRLRRQEFVRHLEHLLMEKYWCQVDLARASGLGRDSISTYLKGKTVPSRLSLQKMAKVFQIEPELLYPNYASADAATEEEMLELEVKSIAGRQSKMWVQVTQVLTTDQAMRNMAIIDK